MKVFLFFLSFLLCVQSQSQLVCDWKKNIGGAGHDITHKVSSTPDGGYIIGAQTLSPLCAEQDLQIPAPIIIKIDSEGNTEWSKCFDDFNDISGSIAVNSIQPTEDGGYLMLLTSQSISKLVRLDSLANIVWENTQDFGAGCLNCYPAGAIILPGNECILFGTKESSTNQIVQSVTKFDSTGNELWQQTYEFENSETIRLANIEKTPDGGYIICGGTNEHWDSEQGELSDAFVMRIDNIGNLVWSRTYGGTRKDYLLDVLATTNGGFVLSGITLSNDGDVSGYHTIPDLPEGIVSTWEDMWIVKIDDEGNIEWQSCIGGYGTDIPVSIDETVSGGYIITGYVQNALGGDWSNIMGFHGNVDIVLVNISNLGLIEGAQFFGGSDSDVAIDFVQSNDSDFLLAGITSSIDGDIEFPLGEYDIFLMKFSYATSIKENISVSISVFPNPTSDHVTINYGDFVGLNGYTLSIFNPMGQLVHSSNITQQQEYLDLNSWGGMGVYQVVVYNPQGVPIETRQIVLQ